MSLKNQGRPPDRGNWTDTGCEESPKCIECKLPACRHDDPEGYQRLLRQRRETLIVEDMRQGGLTKEQVAARLGVTTRTVFRMAARVRAQG